MKDKFLKMAGVKSEQEFYKKFPTEEAFFKAYPQAMEMKKGGNVPTNPELYSRVKSEAKSKFDRWPSAYGSAWLVKTYKSRGGGYRKAQTGGGLQDQEIFQYPTYDTNMLAYAKQAREDEKNNLMNPIGDFMSNAAFAAGAAMDNAQANGEDNTDKMQMAKLAMNVMGMPAMQMGGVGMMMRDNYYDEGGEMAMGQVMAMNDKIARLQNFINANSEIEPWVASKLTLADDYLTSVSDYLQFNEGAENEGEEEEEDTDLTMGELEEMKNGGIPERYKSRGFTKVGVKRQSNRPGKKWMVLAKKGDKYKIVHGGYKGMKDFSQHGSEKRKKNFWNRMGGKDSSKATDPFSPLYWHKRFGTWAEGGEPTNAGFQALPDYVQNKIMSNMAYGGYMPEMGVGGKMPVEIARARFAAAGNLDKLDDYGYAYGGDIYGGQMDMDAIYQMMKKGGSTFSGNAWYQDGGQGQDQVMQAIQMYAQMTQMDPKQLMKQLQALPPLEQQEAIQKIMQAIQQAQQGSSEMAYGGININPANKGKFTASANRAGMGVQEFAKHVLANKEDYSSTQVKRANFAKNAAGWKKQMGGMAEGAELELHPDEIQSLIDQGYGIEYLD